jgi:hypothetical protein
MSERISLAQATRFIVESWRAEIHPQFIMFRLVCLGLPIQTGQVLQLIRFYVDQNDETRTLGRRRK